jgi:membrane associated rhomboid family serine protease
MAFLQSEPAREPFLHAPPVVLWLIGAFVLIHVLTVLSPGTIADPVLYGLSFVPARYSHPGDLFGLTIPLVSHMFLHGSFFHLAVNSLWFLAFGTIVARRYGSSLFLLFFFTCGIAGALTYLAFNWGSPEPVIGASGGISGLMAGGFRMLRWANVPVRHQLTPVLSRPVLVFTGFWVVTNLLLGFTGVGGMEQIAWQAHLGGYFCGLFLINGVEFLHERRSAIAMR